MHLFTRLVTFYQESSLTYANDRLKDVHNETLILHNRNKDFGDDCYRSFIRPMTKGPRVNSKKKRRMKQVNLHSDKKKNIFSFSYTSIIV